MDKNIAKILLENLFSKLTLDKRTGLYFLTGYVLTPDEKKALDEAFGCLKESIHPRLEEVTGGHAETDEAIAEFTDVEEPNAGPVEIEEPIAEPVVKRVPIAEPTEVGGEFPADIFTEIEGIFDSDLETPELDLKSLKFNSPQDSTLTLCLDFGTAMSKAFASIKKDDEIESSVPIKLNAQATKGRSKAIYPVPSSLWISDDGQIFLGETAIALSLQSDPIRNRERFDSLKKTLILGLKEEAPFQSLMRKSLNPTEIPFTTEDAIILYLGFLTDLACTELQQFGFSRYVVRNFGLPSWNPERRAWGGELLKDMLIKAQIVADTFHDKWDSGLNIQEVRSVLDSVKKLNELPKYLVKHGISEPIAVASSRLQKEESFRALTMVIDIGAGTSDFALFLVTKPPNKPGYNAFPIEGCNKSLQQAGDILDAAMQQIILTKSGLGKDSSEYLSNLNHLRMQVRTLKEDIFRDGSCNARLANGTRVTVSIDEFMGHDIVDRFTQKLTDKFGEVLTAVHKSIIMHYGDAGISIVLTGGGAMLPMVQKLASGFVFLHGKQVRKEKVRLVPEEYEIDNELKIVYPQLAVAIGGSSPSTIDEKRAIREMKIPGGTPTLQSNTMVGH